MGSAEARYLALHRGIHNFSGGPGALPASVLESVQEAIIAVPGQHLSVLGISHRSDWFRGVVDEAEAHVRALLALPDDYHVLFLQGGSTLQFADTFADLRRAGFHAGYGTTAPRVMPLYDRMGAAILDTRVIDAEPRHFFRLPLTGPVC